MTRLVAEEDYRRALDAVGLPGIWTSDETSWLRTMQGLSGGERQRLALARLHLHRPDWVVLDEATSALDIAAERQVLAALRGALPAAGFIVIAHRPPQGIGPYRTLDLSVVEDPDAVHDDVALRPERVG